MNGHYDRSTMLGAGAAASMGAAKEATISELLTCNDANASAISEAIDRLEKRLCPISKPVPAVMPNPPSPLIEGPPSENVLNRLCRHRDTLVKLTNRIEQLADRLQL